MLTATRSVLAVPCLEVSIPFYRDALGMRIDFEIPGWCFLSRDNFAVMLGECPDAIAPGQLGDHSYFVYVTVVDAAALFEELRGRSVAFVKRLTDEPWSMREFGIRTVDGHRIMFGQRIASEQDADARLILGDPIRDQRSPNGSEPIGHHFDGGVATIVMDDGNANVMSLAVLRAPDSALGPAGAKDAGAVAD